MYDLRNICFTYYWIDLFGSFCIKKNLSAITQNSKIYNSYFLI